MAELDAQIGLTADASGVEAGVGRAKKSLASLGASATKMGQDVAGAGDKASKALGGLGDGGEKSAKKIERDTKSMQSSIQRYIATLEAGSKDSRKYWETMADFKGVDKNALRPLLDQLDRVTAKTKETENAANRLGGSFTTLRAAASVAIGSVVVQSAAQAATALYEASVQAERLRIMLDFSSARGSVREIAYLRTITSELGLAFGSTATAYSQFQAAARGTALEGEKSRAVFESIAKASAVMGLSAEQSSGVLLALQQMISKGTVQAEELRGQLGERLPGAFQIAARAMGVTTAELGKMLEQGQVIADDFLPKFAKALNESLGDSAEKAANRLDAATNRFSTAWERLKQNAGDSGISQFWAGQINILTDGMNDVSNSMDMARLSGSGFIGQMKAGAGAVLAFANPLNAFSYSAQDLGIKLRDAEKELEALKQAGAERSSNLMLREAFAHAQRLVDKYREAKAAQNALLGVEAEQDPRDQSNFKPRGASYQDYARQQADSEKALIEVRMRAAGVNKQYLADLKTYQDALRLGTMDTGQYIKAVSELATTTYKSSAAGKEAEKSLKGGASEAKKAATEYQRLVETIQTKIATEEQELAGGEKLTDSQRLRMQFAQELQTSLKGLSAAKVAEYTADLNRLEALERENTARKEFLQIAEQERQQRLKIAQAAEQSVESLTTGNQQLRDEIQLIGLSAAEQMEVIRLREEAVLLVKEQHLAEMARAEDLTGTMTRERIALEQEIELRRERLNLMGDKATKEQFAESNREMNREWQRTVDQYGDVFRQGFADMLNNGKDGWKSFTRSLVTTFKTTVADQIYKMFAQPFVVNIVGNLLGVTGGGAGGAAMQMASGGGRGLGSLLNLGSSVAGNWGAISGLFSGTMGIANAAGSIAANSIAATGITDGISALLATNGAYGTAATAGSAAAASSTAGAASGGASGALASIPGWGWAAMGALAILGGSGAFSRKHTQTNLQGTFGGPTGFEGQWEDYYKGGLLRRSKSVYTPLDEETRSGLGGQFSAMRSATVAMAETLGLGTAAISSFTASVNIKLKGLSAEEAQKKIQEEFDKIAESLASTALGTDRFTRSGESSVQTLTRLSGSITAVNSVLEHLNGTFFAASLAGADMASQLADLFGGLEQFSQSAGSYMQNYYSADEQRAAVQRQLQKAFDGLNLKLPDIDAADARAQFRALAEAQDLTTDAGRKTYASLLQLSGAFAGITQSADEAAQAAQQLADQQQRQADDAVNQALAQLRQVVKRERDALSAQADTLESVIGQIGGAVGLLTSNARELYGSVDSTQQMLAAQGMVYIEDALAGVRAGASVVDYGGLADAIGAARSGVNAGVYASEFERQRDTLVLAGQLAELGQISDAQLSVEERALKAVQEQIAQLDKTLDYWEQQASGMGDLLNASLSIEGAIGSLAAALAQREAAKQPAGGGGGGRPGVDFNQGLQQQIAEAWNAGDWITAQNIIRGYGFSNDQLKEAFDLNYADLRYLYSHGYTGQNPGDYSFSAKTAEGVYAEAKAQGLTLAEVDKLINAPAGTAEEWAKANGLPIFHQGTNYVPRTGFALLEQGEQVVPRVYNPFAGGQMPQGNNAELIAEVRALRAEVAALRAPMEQTAQATAQQAEQFDNVTAGGNAMATEVMA